MVCGAPFFRDAADDGFLSGSTVVGRPRFESSDIIFEVGQWRKVKGFFRNDEKIIRFSTMLCDEGLSVWFVTTMTLDIR